MIHRIRASRAARRDRAPEDVVRGLPWRVWTGKGWEKHDASEDPKAFVPNLADDTDNETIKSQLISISNNNSAQQSCSTSGSAGLEANCSSTNPAADHQKQQQQQEQQQQQPWFETQIECAICLCDFVKGDKVRVLPCHHIFHLDEVDEWLIQRKKLVSGQLQPQCRRQFLSFFTHVPLSPRAVRRAHTLCSHAHTDMVVVPDM